MGRQPSSLSCHTCRKRRIKCDAKKPVCSQCEKSRYECLGYDPMLRLENFGVGVGTQPGRQRLVKISQSNSYPVNAPTKTHDATSPDGRTKCRKQKGRGQQTADNLTTDSTTTETEDPRLTLSHRLASWPIQPSLEPFTDNVTFSYFFDAYSWINVHSILLQDTPMRQHLAQQSDELCYDSLRALTYGIFSRDHQVDGLKRTARRIYGKVLQQLQSKLGTASKSELASLIKPISIMGSYAVNFPPSLYMLPAQE